MSKEHRLYFNAIANSWHNKTSFDALLKCMVQFGVSPLDIGAGTGALSGPLLQLNRSGRLVAADISEKMLGAVRNLQPAKRILSACTDACCLAFADETFDKIVCYSTFPHIRHPQKALSEFYRVLKCGGRILIFHNCCSRKLNHYHAKIPLVVSFDKLPKSEYLRELMGGTGFVEIRTVEQPDLYWVEAGKVKQQES